MLMTFTCSTSNYLLFSNNSVFAEGGEQFMALAGCATVYFIQSSWLYKKTLSFRDTLGGIPAAIFAFAAFLLRPT